MTCDPEYKKAGMVVAVAVVVSADVATPKSVDVNANTSEYGGFCTPLVNSMEPVEPAPSEHPDGKVTVTTVPTTDAAPTTALQPAKPAALALSKKLGEVITKPAGKLTVTVPADNVDVATKSTVQLVN